MLPLRTLDDDPSTLSVNPWEEELRERRKKRDEEEERPAIEANDPPKRPSASLMPQTPKGLALVFAKVDHQIGLLDKQINNVRIELLQTRSLVTAVRTNVSKLNKPEASERLEEDAFSNYVRIGRELKSLANRILMMEPDHGRQVALAEEAGTEPVHTDPDENSARESPNSIHRLDESISAVETSRPSARNRDHRDPSHEWARSPEQLASPRTSPRAQRRNLTHGSSAARRHSMKNHHTIPLVYDAKDIPSRLPHQRRYWHFEGPTRIPSPPNRVREEPISQHHPRFDSGSSTSSGSSPYDYLTDSSDFEDRRRRPLIRDRSLPQRRNSVGYTQRRRKVRASMPLTSRKTRRWESHSGQTFNVPELRRNLVTEQSQMGPDELRVVEIVPKSVKRLRAEKEILQNEEAFYLKMLHDVHERIQALRSEQTGKGSEADGSETESSNSNVKGSLWSRLKSKIIDQGWHARQQP